MSATRDLIAAALTVAGAVRWQYPELSDELRELCARALVQPAVPDMGEVERLVHEHEESVILTDRGADYDPHPSVTRGKLLDYVRSILAGDQK